jgi:TPR repeat protein
MVLGSLMAASLVCAPVHAQTPEESPLSPAVTPYARAVQAYDRGAFREAFLAFRHLAQMGHGGAEFMLGVMSFYGRGVERDQTIAAIWFYKSARQGNPAAQLAFGSMFIRGVGVSPDSVEAYKWLSLAHNSTIPDIVSQADTLLRQVSGRMTEDEIKDGQTAASHFQPVTTGPLGME